MTGDLLVVLPHGDPSVKNGIMGMSEQKILVLAVIKTSMLGMLYSGRYDESQQLIIRLDEERTRVEQGEYFETRQNRRWVTWKQICNPGRGPMEIWLCRQTAAGSGCLQYLVNGRGSAVMGGGSLRVLPVLGPGQNRSRGGRRDTGQVLQRDGARLRSLRRQPPSVSRANSVRAVCIC